jgi:hypothetical protein
MKNNFKAEMEINAGIKINMRSKLMQTRNITTFKSNNFDLKGINLSDVQMSNYVKKIAQVSFTNEYLASDLLDELRETKTLSRESKKKMVYSIYQSSPIEELESKLKATLNDVFGQTHVTETLRKLIAEKKEKFAKEMKHIVESRLEDLLSTGNAFFIEEKVAEIRAEMDLKGYITTASDKFIWGTIC